MSAYCLGFAKQMIRAAELILPPRGVCKEEGQAIVYLSLVAIEIILKSMLEQAGYASSFLKKNFSHDIAGLFDEACKLRADVCSEGIDNLSSSIRSHIVKDAMGNETTVGRVLCAEEEGASFYPIGIRYGKEVSHFSPVVVLETAKVIESFSRCYRFKVCD